MHERLNIQTFWDITQCQLVKCHSDSRAVCCFFFHGLSVSTELIALTEVWDVYNISKGLVSPFSR